MKKNELMNVEKKEKGATMVEYALLVALIAIIAILAVRAIGQRASTQFSNISNSI